MKNTTKSLLIIAVPITLILAIVGIIIVSSINEPNKTIEKQSIARPKLTLVGGELSLKSQIASAHLDFVNQTNSILDIDEIRIEFYDNTTETLICTIENSIFLERIGSGEKHSEYVMDTWGLPALLPPGHSYKADIYVDSEFIISVPLYSGVVNEYTYFKVENGKALPLFE